MAESERARAATRTATGSNLMGPENDLLPEHWRLMRLGDVATLQRGIDLPRAERAAGPYPVVGSNGIVGYHSEFKARGPGVFVGRSGSVGKVSRVRMDYWPLNTTLWVRDFHGNDPSFVYYLLSNIDFARYASGVSVPTLNRNLVHPIEVRIPSLPEQRSIGYCLDAVSHAKSATNRVIVATRELKRSLMRHLFTYGASPVNCAEDVELQETEIGQVPKNWRIVRLDEIAETRSGGTPSRAKAQYFDGSIPWVKSGELGDGIVSATEESITAQALRESSAKLFPSGTLLIAMYGATAGKVGVLSMDAATNQAVCAIFPGDAALSSYLFYALMFGRVRLLGERHGGAQPNISQRLLRSFRVPLPPKAEQEEIARILQRVDRKLKVEAMRRDALALVFNALLPDLLDGTRKVTGIGALHD